MLLRDFLAQSCKKCGSSNNHFYGSFNLTTNSLDLCPLDTTSTVLRFTTSDARGMVDLNIPECGIVSDLEGQTYSRVYELDCKSECIVCKSTVYWELDIYPKSSRLNISSTEELDENCPFCNDKLCLSQKVTIGLSPTKKCSSCTFAYNMDGNPIYRKRHLQYIYDISNNLIRVNSLGSSGIDTFIDNKSCQSMSDFVQYALSKRADNMELYK